MPITHSFNHKLSGYLPQPWGGHSDLNQILAESNRPTSPAYNTNKYPGLGKKKKSNHLKTQEVNQSSKTLEEN